MQRTQTQNTVKAGTTRLAMIAVWILSAGNSVFGQIGLPKPETPLLGAAISGNTAAVKELLKAGVNPDEGRLVGLPAVMIPLMMQNRACSRHFWMPRPTFKSATGLEPQP